jgi:hypothetical protein
MTGIHQQENGFFYAWCSCGVVSPLRRTKRLARSDRRAHLACCTSSKSEEPK